MKLNLDKNILSLKGEPMPDKLSDVLADVLAMSTTGKPAKMMAWAVGLVNEGDMEVDKADIKFLSEFIENSPALRNIVKTQLLDEIEKLKE